MVELFLKSCTVHESYNCTTYDTSLQPYTSKMYQNNYRSVLSSFEAYTSKKYVF